MRLYTSALLVALLVHVAMSSETRIKRDNCGTCNSCSSSNCNNGCNSGSCGNVCSGSTCCSSTSCNTCATSCQTTCQTSTCRNNCVDCCNNCNSQNCNCPQTTTSTTVPVPIIYIQPTQPTQIAERPVMINNTIINQANHTAHIHINNVVNNTNVIHVPVYVNTTNVNNIEVSQPAPSVVTMLPYTPPPNNIIEIVKVIDRQNFTNIDHVTERPQKNCCYVIQPRVCTVLPNGEKKCYSRRHRECSDICSSSVVLINGGEQTITYPPPQPLIIFPPVRPPPPRFVVMPPNRPCQTIQQYPWSYCGNYQVQNCGQCYECGGAYNPQACSRSTGCSQQCRNSMFRCNSNDIRTYCL